MAEELCVEAKLLADVSGTNVSHPRFINQAVDRLDSTGVSGQAIRLAGPFKAPLEILARA